MNFFKNIFKNNKFNEENETKPLIVTFTYDNYIKIIYNRNEKPMDYNEFKSYYLYNKTNNNNNDNNYINHLKWSEYNQYRILHQIYNTDNKFKTFEEYIKTYYD
jgi:hypothetical protein